MASEYILQTNGLTKEFKGFTAVKDVNLKVRRGTIHALIGPERRRQDHLLQSAHQVPAADARAASSTRAGTSRREPGRRGAAGAGAVVPDLGGVPAPDGARERARRAAARRSATPSTSGARSAARRAERARAASCWTLWACRASPSCRRSSCPTAASGRSRSPPRSRSSRRCCCSTSRPRAWAHEDVERIAALIRRVAADRTVLMVEHNLSVVADLSDRITVLARGEVLAEGDYADGLARTRR